MGWARATGVCTGNIYAKKMHSGKGSVKERPGLFDVYSRTPALKEVLPAPSSLLVWSQAFLSRPSYAQQLAIFRRAVEQTKGLKKDDLLQP